ncbi:MAG: quinolinate synthase NadA [Candidatus Sumerlaeota bacterium]|nr:quinolinate synthase NadA [Candidatus Sumerlaeota bacterium]
MDYVAGINRLRRELNAVILAHYYQIPEIQDVADFVGDSLGLSQQAAGTNADVIVFAGVHFMAETAKILSPTKKVLLPDMEAGCSLAEACPADELREFKKEHPGHIVLMYVNSSAETKAESDIIVTSANAEKIVRQIPPDQKIIFGPDKNLGAFIAKKTGREMVLWPGVCEVHVQFSEKKIKDLKKEHPTAEVIAHPECEDHVLGLADFIGSTTALIKRAKQSPKTEFIVVTEPGVIHQMKKECPGKTFIEAPVEEGECACNQCKYMKMNTLEKLYLCMNNGAPEITVPEDIRVRALRPIQRMLEMS